MTTPSLCCSLEVSSHPLQPDVMSEREGEMVRERKRERGREREGP